MNETSLALPAHRLARGRKTLTYLIAYNVVLTLLSIAALVYCFAKSDEGKEVVVFDANGGNLILSPIVDPAKSAETIQTEAVWAAQCILERTPTGLKNEPLAACVLNADTLKQARKEYESEQKEYRDKELRTSLEVSHFDSQAIGGGQIVATVQGKVIVDGIVDGEGVRDPRPVTLKLLMARNPDLTRYKHYPLVVLKYGYDKPPEGSNPRVAAH